MILLVLLIINNTMTDKIPQISPAVYMKLITRLFKYLRRAFDNIHTNGFEQVFAHRFFLSPPV